MTKLYDKALAFATAAHGRQMRKYTGEPYVTHVIRVANTLHNIGAPDHVVAAALLHDVLEDTTVTRTELVTEFGVVIADLVAEVTDVSKRTDGNRATRKAIDKAHLAKATYWGATIKLADLLDNTKNIIEFDPKFAELYIKEKNDLLPVLAHGHPELWTKAMLAALKRGDDL